MKDEHYAEYHEDRRREDGRINEIRETLVRIEERMKANERALEIASHDIDRRLEEMNAFRTQLANERWQYVPRNEYEIKHNSLSDHIAALQKFQWAVSGGLLVIQIVIAVMLHSWH